MGAFNKLLDPQDNAALSWLLNPKDCGFPTKSIEAFELLTLLPLAMCTGYTGPRWHSPAATGRLTTRRTFCAWPSIRTSSLALLPTMGTSSSGMSAC